MDVAGHGNYFLVVPYLLFVVAGVAFIMVAMRDRKDSPSVPNLMARRNHPLRHVQVEINRARKEARERADRQEGDEDKKPREETRTRKGPRWLRRV